MKKLFYEIFYPNTVLFFDAMKKFFVTLYPYAVLFLAVFFVYGIVFTNTSFYLSSHNWFNSYSLQAYRWLQGHLDLGQYYGHLEIAIHNGQYWVSFPPFPSIILLPFVAIIRSPYTPDHYIAMGVFLLVVVYAYKLARSQIKNRAYALFLTLFLCLGTNYLQIAMRGIVWHIAQNLAFLFVLMAIYYAITKVRWHSFLSLFFLCCAMGSRPISGIYLPLIVCLIYEREGWEFLSFVKKFFIYSIPALILGGFFLWLNYARFGNIFEFGHNYLHASMYAEHGQFSRMYTLNHLRIMLFRIPTQLPVFSTRDAIFQPIAFWIASPMVISYIVYMVYFIKSKIKRNDFFEVVYLMLIPILIVVHLLALASHKDVGGPQFGYRYTLDVLPVMFFGLVAILGRIKLNTNVVYLNLFPFVVGFTVNILATIHSLG